MALLNASYSANQTNAELVAAVAGKLIRIVRILATFEASGTFKLISSPGQPYAADLTGLLYLGAGSLIQMDLGRAQGLVTERGKALGYTSNIGGASKGQGLMIWYELID